jgi:protein ImuA
VVWCLTRPDLFFPALAQAGLHPKRVVFVESDREEDVAANMEEALSFGGCGAVIGEMVRLPMVVSRRLQLVAERTGTIALAVRRWRRQTEAHDFGQPTASTTRWRVSVLPSEELPVPGIGRPRWLLELMRSRAGECAEFIVGACDDQGRLHIPAGSVDGSNTSRRSLHSG